MDKFKNLPKTAGVYLFYEKKQPIYIGKAANIQNRVKNHFSQPSYRDNLFINKVSKIKFLKTNSEIEALLLEANLIKKYQPKYNVTWRDDKNYFYVAIAKNEQKIPYTYITHQIKNLKIKNLKIQYIGPFVEGAALKKTLRFLRRVFPYYTAKKHPKNKCTYCHLDLCPGPNPDLAEYKKNIKKLILVLKGKRKTALSSLRQEMKTASKNQDFEKAGKIRDQTFALQQVLAHTHVIENSNLEFRISKPDELMGRIEAYDVSNIQGKNATGSMIVFVGGQPDKNQYRKFKIKTGDTPNDIAMLKEILKRRFSHPEWKYPDVILIDGGKAQLNIAIKTIKQLHVIVKSMKVMSVAKGRQELFVEGKKNPVPLKSLPQQVYNLIKQLDDEAHRFAISYHKALRKKTLLR